MIEEQTNSVFLVCPSEVVPDPDQPRKRFCEDSVRELAEGMVAHGQLQPVLVRPVAGREGEYMIVFGETRWRAACYIRDNLEGGASFRLRAELRDLTDEEALILQMQENMKRTDMSAMEEAKGFARLKDQFSLTLEDIAQHLATPKTRVYERLNLLTLPTEIQAELEEGSRPLWQANVALRIPKEMATKESLLRAIHLAEESGSFTAAKLVIENRISRPWKERKRWEVDGLDVPAGEVLSYDVSREVFPPRSTVIALGSDWVLADRETLPVDLAMGVESGTQWGVYAERFGATIYTACDGDMIAREVVKRSEVLEAAYQYFSEECDACSGSGRVDGEECGTCRGKGNVIDVDACPFQAPDLRGKREQEAHAKSEFEKSVEGIVPLLSSMLTDLETAIRARVGLGLSSPEMMAEAAAFLMGASFLGEGIGDESPVHQLMCLTNRRSSADGKLWPDWNGIHSTQAGAESAMVCAWVLYWVQAESLAEPRQCAEWIRACNMYGLSPEGSPE